MTHASIRAFICKSTASLHAVMCLAYLVGGDVRTASAQLVGIAAWLSIAFISDRIS